MKHHAILLLPLLLVGCGGNDEATPVASDVTPAEVSGSSVATAEPVTGEAADNAAMDAARDDEEWAALTKPIVVPVPSIAFEPTSMGVINHIEPYEPASQANLESGELVALFASYRLACEAGDAELFYGSYIQRTRYLFSKWSKEELAQYQANLCRGLPELARQLAGGATIASNGYNKEDGQYVSYLCLAKPSGDCSGGGLELGIEGGKLKFAEH